MLFPKYLIAFFSPHQLGYEILKLITALLAGIFTSLKSRLTIQPVRATATMIPLTPVAGTSSSCPGHRNRFRFVLIRKVSLNSKAKVAQSAFSAWCWLK